MRERQFSFRHLKEIADNDKWCLMPKENGGEVSSEKRSEEAMWSCQGDGGGEEMLQLKGTQGEKIMEKHFSLTQKVRLGEKKKMGWKDEKPLKEQGKVIILVCQGNMKL